MSIIVFLLQSCSVRHKEILINYSESESHNVRMFDLTKIVCNVINTMAQAQVDPNHNEMFYGNAKT